MTSLVGTFVNNETMSRLTNLTMFVEWLEAKCWSLFLRSWELRRWASENPPRCGDSTLASHPARVRVAVPTFDTMGRNGQLGLWILGIPYIYEMSAIVTKKSFKEGRIRTFFGNCIDTSADEFIVVY